MDTMIDTAAKLHGTMRETWPAERPIPALAGEAEVGRPTGGLAELVETIVASRTEPIKTIVEVGGELGGSTRFFLRQFPDAQVITIDPWPANYRHISKKWPQIATHAEADGLSYYRVFMSLNWEWRDRLLPLRATSGEGLPQLFAMGLKPDLIYIDGMHTFHGCYDDLTLAFHLFPGATIAGDDWEFNPGLEHHQFMGYLLPVRRAVTEFAFAHGRLEVRTAGNCYFIEAPATA